MKHVDIKQRVQNFTFINYKKYRYVVTARTYFNDNSNDEHIIHNIIIEQKKCIGFACLHLSYYKCLNSHPIVICIYNPLNTNGDVDIIEDSVSKYLFSHINQDNKPFIIPKINPISLNFEHFIGFSEEEKQTFTRICTINDIIK